MSIDPREKVVLFIDGANLYATSKAIGIDIDYRRLLAEFQSKAYLLRAYYYTALVEDQEYSSIRPLIDWLDYNGFTVVTKPAKEFTDATGRRKIKGNMDIELTVDALEMAPYFDHMVLFSGDGDFTALVAALQRRGKRVTVVTPGPRDLAVMGVISGAVLGGAQGLVLAREGHRGLAVPWALAMPVLFALGWCASTAIGVNVEDQYTVFGAAGAVLFMVLSGLLLARFTPTRTHVA